MMDLRLSAGSKGRGGPAPREKFAAGARSSVRCHSQRCPLIRAHLDRRLRARGRERQQPSYCAGGQLGEWLAALVAVRVVARRVERVAAASAMALRLAVAEPPAAALAEFAR